MRDRYNIKGRYKIRKKIDEKFMCLWLKLNTLVGIYFS